MWLVNGIDADVQNLGMKRGELLPGGVERRHLRGSSGGPVEGVEGDHHVLPAAKIAEPHAEFAFPGNRGKVEVGSRIAGLQSHSWLSVAWEGSGIKRDSLTDLYSS